MRDSFRGGLVALAATLALALAGPACAQGAGANAGSGLSPSSSATGNDRTAGVNNGNYRRPGGYGTRRGYRSGKAWPHRIIRGRAHRY